VVRNVQNPDHRANNLANTKSRRVVRYQGNDKERNLRFEIRTPPACGSSQCVAKIDEVISRAKFSTVLVVTIVVPIGLLFSQLCALNCSLNNCSPAAPVKTAQSDDKPPCHHHGDKQESAPQPEKEKQPNRCPGHFESVASVPSVIGASGTLDQHTQPLAGPLASSRISFENHNVSLASDAPFRAPPVRAVISALRI